MRTVDRPTVVAVRAGHDRTAALRRLFGALHLPESARRIVVKLNLCDYRLPNTGVVSDPAVVGSLLRVLAEHYPGAQLNLCENDASDTLVENIWGYLGLDTIAAEHGAEIRSLSREPWVAVPWADATFDIPALFRECDLIVNHPKLKTHGKTRMTCGLKNLFGCYRAKDKRPLHQYLDRAIVEINRVLPVHLTVVDADLCVEGNRGPTQGLPKRVGLFIGGCDIVAVDAFCATLMGFAPRRIGHIRAAARAGLGRMQYELVGDLTGTDLGPYAFEYSEARYWLMHAVRRVMSWSAVP